MSYQIQMRRDTSTNWTSTNPILAQGEFGVETNTLKLKIGDGTTAWNSLGYYASNTVTTVTASAPLASSGGATPNITITQSSGSTNGYLSSTDWTTFNNKGSVSSVAMTVPSILSVSGSPVTTTGTLAITLANQSANTIFAGPTSGIAAAPTFRAMVAADVPTLNQNTTGSAATLSPGRTINGTLFDGSANITVTAAAGTLTGATLASNVLSSSLTSVGTITSGVWTGTTIAIANGGTGATTASAAFNALSPLTTKGDILTYSTLNARLPVGTDGQVLTADSTTATGLKWATPTTGNVTSVAMTVPSFLSVSGSPITSSGTLALSLSGTALPVANGGTGTTTTFTEGSVIFAGPSGVYSQNTAGMVWLDSIKRLGVGTAAPNSALHLASNGNTPFTMEGGASAHALMLFRTSTTPRGYLGYANVGTTGIGIFNGAGSTVNLLLTDGGNLGIGTTTPSFQLQLSTDSAAKPSTSSWTISSDERLKDIQGNFSTGLSAIEAIQPIYFNYKEGNERNLPTDKTSVGIIAQQVQQVIPEAITVGGDGYLSMNTDAIFWTLLNAVKELSNKVKILEEKLSEPTEPY